MLERNNKILIINSSLGLGGTEKLIYEISKFAKQERIEPTILILDNYTEEYYDTIFKKNNIKIIRTRIDELKHFRNPIKMIKSIFWAIKLRFYADNFYSSIHVMGLYNVYKVLDTIKHKHRFFWHVNNSAQYNDRKYNFYGNIFGDDNDTIVCINKYQIEEIKSEYNISLLKSKILLFKLFTN